MVGQVLQGQPLPAGPHFDVGAGLLAEDVVGHGHHGHHGHPGMGAHLGFDRGGTDVLPTPNDEVRRTTDDGEIALVVDLDDVTHQHPPVGGHEPLVGFVIVVVPEAGGRPPASGDAGTTRDR